MQLHISPGPESLATDASKHIAALLESGCSDIGLAGGSTPRATYEALTRRDIDWSNVNAWLTDERWVHLESQDSNGAMAKSNLIDSVEGLRLHRPVYAADMDPAISAEAYERVIGDFTDGAPDLVLLGMGTDGHVASLFPGTAALQNTHDQRWFVANHVPQLDTWRLTATPHLLQIARNVLVIVTGEAKAEVLAEAFERPNGQYPIELLHEATGEVTIFADAAAANRLTGRST